MSKYRNNYKKVYILGSVYTHIFPDYPLRKPRHKDIAVSIKRTNTRNLISSILLYKEQGLLGEMADGTAAVKNTQEEPGAISGSKR